MQATDITVRVVLCKYSRRTAGAAKRCQSKHASSKGVLLRETSKVMKHKAIAIHESGHESGTSCGRAGCVPITFRAALQAFPMCAIALGP